ncbi:MAG: LytTR family transcriptional regulator [Oscillospiraceae bacterium]|nr:LytTR family transcriptional regulator [Oscillospiraceae bacterium]
MIFSLSIDQDCQETVIACVHARTPLINEIERLVMQDGLSDRIPGYADGEISMLEVCEIECFIVEDEKTFALYDGKKHLVRKRLYELENELPGDYERISKSAIANWKKISKFKVQLSGAVDAVFKSGYVECISRRCFAELKRRYGL